MHLDSKPPDIVFLSSVFNQIKIAEPMGVSILTAAVRAQGMTATVREPSVRGWSIADTVREVIATGAPIVALSVLRDKNVHDVLRFCVALRESGSRQFVVAGGHGPSLTLSGVASGVDVRDYIGATPRVPESDDAVCSTTNAVRPMKQGALVEPEFTGRGQGPATVTPSPVSTYYDVSREYLSILTHIDAFVIGEADETFPQLARKVLDGVDHRDVPGLVYLDDAGRLVKNPPPPKIGDLSTLPLMARDTYAAYLRMYQEVPASILASRGCFYRCTFCSVVRYENLQEGLSHRFRSNRSVVDEIRALHDTYGCTKFNFEDDNFVVKNARGRERLRLLCDDLIALPFPVEFTFFCRADVVDRELFAHLKAAGLTGIYFGVESVYPGDLEFFHKGIRVEHVYSALRTLAELGFSPDVGSSLRIMLGYITWHPRTSYESLAATSAFLRQWHAPPKLLRRKLRLYTGTEVLSEVARLGLLRPAHRDGWVFAEDHLQGLDDRVNDLFGHVNRGRDMLRTIEKAAQNYRYPVPVAPRARELRLAMDRGLFDAFDQICAVSRDCPDGGNGAEVRELVADLKGAHDARCADLGVEDVVTEGYAACGFDRDTVDLFRK